MADLPRLNGVIRAFESGHPAFATFSHVSSESAIALQGSGYDGVVFESEHNMWDGPILRDALQYLLNRGQIVRASSVAPAITPIVRIPPNGMEKNQFFAKQALDLGAFGIVWPHVSTVEQAYNAVAACRYPRIRTDPSMNLPGSVAMVQQRPYGIGGCHNRNTTSAPMFGRWRPTVSSWSC
jgi:4-hydroxy-2-oxoheptanedioate aldolase